VGGCGDSCTDINQRYLPVVTGYCDMLDTSPERRLMLAPSMKFAATSPKPWR
jgi:hypothetical protein